MFRLLALGFTAKKIAEKLIVSENTAKTHVRHVYAKLEIHSRDELNQIVDSLASAWRMRWEPIIVAP